MTEKTEKYIERFINFNPNFFESFSIIGDYNEKSGKIKLKNKYGLIDVLPYSLLAGTTPTILSAVNKTEYWINMVKEVHGDTYDYSLANYIRADTHVNIKCKKHNFIFPQTPNNHLNDRGCPICRDEIFSEYQKGDKIGYSFEGWVRMALRSKIFDSYKVYIIKCWNEKEEFYKIGKTFATIKNRFIGKREMPYNYKIFKLVIGDAQYISQLEDKYKKTLKKYRYIPKLKFSGVSECFKI